MCVCVCVFKLGHLHVLLIIPVAAIGPEHSLRPNVIPCEGL